MPISWIFASMSMIFALVLAMGMAEIALRVLEFPKEAPVGWRWDRSPYRGAESLNSSVNQLGLRGQQINHNSRDTVVLLVGDSYVEAGMQTEERMPERILQRALREKFNRENILVYSIAAAGWSQDQQLIALGEYFSRYRADLVISWVTPVNDYWENSFLDRSVTSQVGPLKPSFSLKSEDKHIQTANVYPMSYLGRLVDFSYASMKYGSREPLNDLYMRRWFRTLPKIDPQYAQKDVCPQNIIRQDAIVSHLRGSGTAATVLTYEDITQNRSHFSPFTVPSSNRDRYQITLTHVLLEEIRKISHRHNAAFLGFYPGNSDLDRALKTIKCVTTADGSMYMYDGDITRHLRTTSLWADFVVADLGAVRPNTLSEADWHLNYEGNVVAMQQLADTIGLKLRLP